mgnify:CR=1 FL=1
MTLMRFHFYNKIHLIHRHNLEKSWTKVGQKFIMNKVNMKREDYVRLLEKYNINNGS